MKERKAEASRRTTMALSTTPEEDVNENQNPMIVADRSAAMTTSIGSDDHQNPIKLGSILKASRFATPMLSASSTAVNQSAKILTERNGASSASSGSNPPDSCPGKSNIEETGQSQDVPHESTKNHPLFCSPSATPAYDWEIDAVSTKPYDPVTNYFAPRPKYLRYNPDRRSVVLLQRERRLMTEAASVSDSKQVDEETSSSDNSCSCSSSSSSDSGCRSPNSSNPKPRTLSKRVKKLNHASSKSKVVSLDSWTVEDEKNRESREISPMADVVSVDARSKVDDEKPSSDSDTTFGSSSAPASKADMNLESKEIFSLKSKVASMNAEKVKDENPLLHNTFGSANTPVSTTETSSKCEEVNEDFDEEEEVNRSYGGGLKWPLFKIFLVMAIWGLATAYISTMNSSSPAPVLGVIRVLKNEYQQVEESIVKAIYRVKDLRGKKGKVEVGYFEQNSEVIDVIKRLDEDVGKVDGKGGKQDSVDESSEAQVVRLDGIGFGGCEAGDGCEDGNGESDYEVDADFEESEWAENSVAVDGSESCDDETVRNHKAFSDVAAPDFEDSEGENTVAIDQALEESSDVVVDYVSGRDKDASDMIRDDAIGKEDRKHDPAEDDSDTAGDPKIMILSDLQGSDDQQLEEGKVTSQEKSCSGINQFPDDDTANEPENELKSDLQSSCSDHEEIRGVNDRVKMEHMSEVELSGLKQHSWWYGMNNSLIWVSIGGLLLLLAAVGSSLVMRFYLCCKATSARSGSSSGLSSKRNIKFQHHPYEDRSSIKTPFDPVRDTKSIPHSVSWEETTEAGNAFATPTRMSSSSVTPDVRLLGEIKMGDLSGSLIRSSRSVPSVRDSKAWDRKGDEQNQRGVFSNSRRSVFSNEQPNQSSDSYGSFVTQKKKEEATTMASVRRSPRLRSRGGGVSP